MNIFALDIDPEQAAMWHCDSHTNKMILETAQMLSTINRMAGNSGPIYKATHKNHMCTVWARQSTENYLWLWRLGVFLSAEFEARYGHAHKSTSILHVVKEPPDIVPAGRLTKFALCMPDKYKQSNPVEAYRNFYRAEKASGRLGTWKRNKPDWWNG